MMIVESKGFNATVGPNERLMLDIIIEEFLKTIGDDLDDSEIGALVSAIFYRNTDITLRDVEIHFDYPF